MNDLTKEVIVERVDKLFGREFLLGLLGVALLTAAYFARPEVEFNDYGFWMTLCLGVPVAGLSVPKVAGSLTRTKE